MCILVICASSGSLKENWCICYFAIENTELLYFFAGALFVSLFTVLICFFYSVATKEGNKNALPSNIIIYLEEIQDKIYIHIIFIFSSMKHWIICLLEKLHHIHHFFYTLYQSKNKILKLRTKLR